MGIGEGDKRNPAKGSVGSVLAGLLVSIFLGAAFYWIGDRYFHLLIPPHVIEAFPSLGRFAGPVVGASVALMFLLGYLRLPPAEKVTRDFEATLQIPKDLAVRSERTVEYLEMCAAGVLFELNEIASTRQRRFRIKGLQLVPKPDESSVVIRLRLVSAKHSRWVAESLPQARARFKSLLRSKGVVELLKDYRRSNAQKELRQLLARLNKLNEPPAVTACFGMSTMKDTAANLATMAIKCQRQNDTTRRGQRLVRACIDKASHILGNSDARIVILRRILKIQVDLLESFEELET